MVSLAIGLAIVMTAMLVWLLVAEPLGLNDVIRRFRRSRRRRTYRHRKPQ